MKTPLYLFAGVAALMLLGLARHEAPVVAQQLEDFTLNPDINVSPNRTEADASLGAREARQRIYEAITLESAGKKEEALDKWRDAYGRYEALRQKYLDPRFWGNNEIMVRAEYPPNNGGRSQDSLYTETWIPLVDHINANFRDFEWPRTLRDRMVMRQQAPGAEMLANAIAKDDLSMLRRCARFYQFSDAGRTALGMLALQTAEAGDSLLALRWLDEYRTAWPEFFDRDPMLNLLLVRACRETDSRLRMDQALRRISTAGLDGKVDVGGVRRTLREQLDILLATPAPSERRELTAPGWRTQQGAATRNLAGPPVSEITGIVPIGASENVPGYSLGKAVEKAEPDPYGYSYEEPPAQPVVFPTVHESGIFVHRAQSGTAGAETPEQLLWMRHGREGSPVQLEVPKALRYTMRADRGRNSRGWWGGQNYAARTRSRILSSTIGRLRWPLDNRESDVLFAVMGQGNPQSEHPSEPTGNQIQSFDLSPDASLRVTLPNRKVEPAQEWAFLQHMNFMGAPIVQDNKLYIAGATAEKASIEFWVLCFDVTPKGDPAAGEGKLLWRTQTCALANKQAAWGPQTVNLTDMSSMALQGGMLYLSTHSGATCGVDRQTGELCWVSRYRRPGPTSKGWFNNAPVAVGGYVVCAPYDSLANTGSEIALILDGIRGNIMFEQPRKGKGYKGEYEYTLGVVDNRMIIQGRNRLHCITLSSFRKGGGVNETDWGNLMYQSADFEGANPVGRGVIAGDRVLVPFKEFIRIYDVNNGKLLSKYTYDPNVKIEGGAFTLTVFCRGEAYKDTDGLTRYKPVTVTDPQTGNVYNVEHLPNGSDFTFPSGAKAKVVKETFVLLASSSWVYLFTAKDSGN